MGIILMVIGLGVVFWGLGNAESDYSRLNSTQLAAKTLTEVLAPDITAVGVGLFLFVAGIIVFLASSNKDATKGIKSIFKNR